MSDKPRTPEEYRKRNHAINVNGQIMYQMFTRRQFTQPFKIQGITVMLSSAAVALQNDAWIGGLSDNDVDNPDSGKDLLLSDAPVPLPVKKVKPTFTIVK